MGQEHPLEEGIATHSSILSWRIPWTEKSGRLESTGSQRVGHDWATSLYYTIWRPTRPSRTNTQKRCPFHYRGLGCKKSRNTWGNRQIWPWNTEWSRAKANKVLPRECNSHSKYPLPTTKEKTTHGHDQMVNTEIRLIIFFQPKMEKLYTVNKNKTSSWLWLRSWTPYCQIQT